jgi:methylenetetrahydrofolate dehydrogenase (NADP+)/methenyltetrahydrofolate cyclohydrolase
MPAKIIDGRKIAADIRSAIKLEIDERSMDIRIVSFVMGTSDAAEVYIKQKAKACAEVGITMEVVRLDIYSTKAQISDEIHKLARGSKVTGMLFELPLPEHVDVSSIVGLIPPQMDIDGMSSDNLGRLLMGKPCLAPSTPSAVMEILASEKVELKGAEVTVVNHSNIVGKPTALMLLNKNASVRVAHVFTKNLKAHTKDADVIVTAAGVPGLIKADMVKKGATVIDVAMNRVGDKLCGDVEFDEVSKKAGAITPVPGGVGPVTVAMLLLNALTAFRLQNPKG